MGDYDVVCDGTSRSQQIKCWDRVYRHVHVGDLVGPPRLGLAPEGTYTLAVPAGGFLHVARGVLTSWTDEPGDGPLLDVRGDLLNLDDFPGGPRGPWYFDADVPADVRRSDMRAKHELLAAVFGTDPDDLLEDYAEDDFACPGSTGAPVGLSARQEAAALRWLTALGALLEGRTPNVELLNAPARHVLPAEAYEAATRTGASSTVAVAACSLACEVVARLDVRVLGSLLQVLEHVLTANETKAAADKAVLDALDPEPATLHPAEARRGGLTHPESMLRERLAALSEQDLYELCVRVVRFHGRAGSEVVPSRYQAMGVSSAALR